MISSLHRNSIVRRLVTKHIKKIKMNELTDNDELYGIICQHDHADELDTRLNSLSNVDEILMFLHLRDEQCLTLLGLVQKLCD
ncbi:unnamed protein product [Rotaria sordida]|uniref:Uncharacterized protein n=1 Tax=Rotaria sordida TaxID=392033 RepID=A0A818L3A3_9BILA|nr:unnamed protein product [Rotaria sordida]CAF3571926.1 unnamed protein product [Rotaria sordida]